MQWIPSARSLEALLESSASDLPDDLPEQLGRLVAQLADLGLEHGDLFPGNLVLDEADKLWLVDFGRARACDPARLKREHRDLVTLCGSLREQTTDELRGRLIARYDELVGGAHERAAFVAEIERDARRARRRAVLRNLGRWTREGRLVRVVESAGRTELRARREPEEHSTLVAIRGADATRAWLTAARLVEHHLPTLPPVRLLRAPDAAAEFELAPGVRALREARADHGAGDLAFHFGALLGRLHDRGLTVARVTAAELYVDPSGALRLSPAASLADHEPGGAAQPAHRLDFLSAATRARFGEGYDEGYRAGNGAARA